MVSELVEAMVSDLIKTLDGFLEANLRVSHNRRKRRALRPIERRLERAMQRAFRAQGRAFVKRFARLRELFVEALTPRDWEPLFDEATIETVKLFTDPIDIAVGQALQAGALANIAELGVEGSFDLANPRAVAYLQDYGARRVTMITEETRRQIQQIVTRGVDQGWSYDRTAKAITDRFSEFAIGKPQQHIRSRAHLVAITESAEAYEHGNRIVADDLQAGGLEMEKHWWTVGDSKVSEGCANNEAEGWIPLDVAHVSGHHQPPRFPGCRCDELYRRVGAGA